MKRAVGITGARGVLGRRIAEALHRRGVAAVPFAGDVNDAEAVDAFVGDAGAIIHCAAVVPTQIAETAPARAARVNIEGTINVAAAARRFGRHLIYVSSSHVYRPSAQPLAETDPTDPISAYGLTKLQGEQWATRVGGSVLITRVFSFFDERQPDSYLVPALLKRIRSAAPGARLSLHGASNVRDIAAAAYLANLVAGLALTDATGVVNCGTGTGVTILELAQALAKALGRDDVAWDPLVDERPSRLVANAGRLADLIGPLPPYHLAEALRSLAAAAPG